MYIWWTLQFECIRQSRRRREILLSFSMVKAFLFCGHSRLAWSLRAFPLTSRTWLEIWQTDGERKELIAAFLDLCLQRWFLYLSLQLISSGACIKRALMPSCTCVRLTEGGDGKLLLNAAINGALSSTKRMRSAWRKKRHRTSTAVRTVQFK